MGWGESSVVRAGCGGRGARRRRRQRHEDLAVEVDARQLGARCEIGEPALAQRDLACARELHARALEQCRDRRRIEGHQSGVDERKPIVAVNKAAALQKGGNWLVYVVEGSRLKEMEFQATATTGDLIATPGLKAGDRVVLRPTTGLRNGQRIEIASP